MNDQDIEAARVVAFRFLGYSARTRSELERRLERGGFETAVTAQVVEEMIALGYIDDTQFARHWIEDRADRKRYGRTRLASELRRKGADADATREALDGINDDDEFRCAEQAVSGRWSSESLHGLDSLSLSKEKARIAGFLQRRGFQWPTIEKVLQALLQNVI